MSSGLRDHTSKHGRPMIICWTICLSFIWWSVKSTPPGGGMVFLVTVRWSPWRRSRNNPAKREFCIFLEFLVWTPERNEHVPQQNGQADTQYRLNHTDLSNVPKLHTYHLGDDALFQISLGHSPQNHALCVIPALSWNPCDPHLSCLDAQNRAHGLFLCYNDQGALKRETRVNPNFQNIPQNNYFWRINKKQKYRRSMWKYMMPELKWTYSATEPLFQTLKDNQINNPT